MSAFSPKTAWDENVEKGHHFLTHYNGDPNFDMPGMGEHVDKAKAIYHAGEPGAEYADPKDVIKGPKTSAFRNNIHDDTPMREPRPGEHDDVGYYHHPVNPTTGEPDWRLSPDQDSTIDTHHVRMANTPHGADLSGLKYETPKHFGQSVMADGQELDPSYDLYSRAAWEATRRQNAGQGDPHRHLLPKQMQAGPWGKFKTDVDSAGKGANFTEPGKAPKSWDPNKKNFTPEDWGKKHPFTSPKPAIPRYQQDHGDWEDPRRPKEDLRTSPNWHRHRKSSTASPWWDHVLADYIARHPQHPVHPGEHFARTYFAGAEEGPESIEPKKRLVRTKPQNSKNRNKLPKTIHQPKEPKKMVGMHSGSRKSGPWLLEASLPKKASPPAAPGAQPPGGNWGAMPDVKLGPSSPAGYQPGATPSAAWTKTPSPNLSGGNSSYASPSGGGASSVAPTQTNKGTTGPDTHGSILPDTETFKTNLQKQFPQLDNIGGYRNPDGFNEHSSGHALDVMIPDATTQNQVRNWALKQPNVNYILNQQKQWNPDGSSSAMENRGSPTANHFDHLHVNVADAIKPLPGLKGLGDDDGSGSSSGDQTPGTGMTIARKFALQYFARDPRDDQDQEPGSNTGQTGTTTSTPTDSAGYGGASSMSPANMDLSLRPPSPGSFTPSFSGGGGGGASSAPYTGGGGGNTGVTPGPGGIPISVGPDGHVHSSDPAWEHLIERESGGINQRQHGYTDVNTGGNEAEGYFQITPKTWAGAGGTKYAPSPMAATPQQQADVAAGIFRKNPSGGDWGAGLPGRENAGALAKGLSAPVSTGPSLPSVGAPAAPKAASMHSGDPKSGAWLLEASRHVDS